MNQAQHIVAASGFAAYAGLHRARGTSPVVRVIAQQAAKTTTIMGEFV
ncbi:MAG: hypothetical protein K2Y28_10105 [Burkholderiaceae bacterium]|nr:hypothetical protein [Burkholderiaceae bacterium]